MSLIEETKNESVDNRIIKMCDDCKLTYKNSLDADKRTNRMIAMHLLCDTCNHDVQYMFDYSNVTPVKVKAKEPEETDVERHTILDITLDLKKLKRDAFMYILGAAILYTAWVYTS